jgi:thymidylate synthase ThyX
MTYNFFFEGITTKTLLALTRHDVGVEFSVQSTRYTTKKAVKNNTASYTLSKSDKVNKYLVQINDMIIDCVNSNEANDEISMLLPQAWQYNLTCSMSLTAVQHFLALRLKKDAHWDIRDLANHILASIPKDHLYLYDDYISDTQEPING